MIAMGIIWQVFEWNMNRKERLRDEFYRETHYFSDKIFEEQKSFPQELLIIAHSFNEVFSSSHALFRNAILRDGIEKHPEIQYLAQIVFQYINFLIEKESLLHHHRITDISIDEIIAHIPYTHFLYSTHLLFLSESQKLNQERVEKILAKYTPFFQKYIQPSGEGVGTFEADM